jgi:hypothetical protein
MDLPRISDEFRGRESHEGRDDGKHHGIGMGRAGEIEFEQVERGGGEAAPRATHAESQSPQAGGKQIPSHRPMQHDRHDAIHADGGVDEVMPGESDHQRSDGAEGVIHVVLIMGMGGQTPKLSK